MSRSCYECGRSFSSRHALAMASVHVDLDEGGYERIDVPMCLDCRKERNGHDCPECGRRYLHLEDAALCCEGRKAGEAPDCPECNRRMKRVSWGYTAGGQPTCEYAVCEACDVGWGKYTGWHNRDEQGGETA